MPVNLSLQMIVEILIGLQAMHDSGVIHFDIKPGNILLDKDNTPKICDFGLSEYHEVLDKRHQADCMTQHEATAAPAVRYASAVWFKVSSAKGSIKYQDPVLLHKEGVYNQCVDHYSLVTMLWELLTNCLPWQGTERYFTKNRDITNKQAIMRLKIKGDTLPLGYPNITSLGLTDFFCEKFPE